MVLMTGMDLYIYTPLDTYTLEYTPYILPTINLNKSVTGLEVL